MRLAEAAFLLGIKPESVRTQIRRGNIDAQTVCDGFRIVLDVSADAIRQYREQHLGRVGKRGAGRKNSGEFVTRRYVRRHEKVR